MKVFAHTWMLLPAIFGSMTVAQAVPLPIPPPALVKQIEQELLPYVRTLSRPVTLWHWTHRSDTHLPLTGFVHSDDRLFSDYLQRRASSYFRYSPRNYSAEGTGLYLALDPISTASYGGVHGGALVQLDLDPGTRFIEIGAGSLSAPLLEKMRLAGCEAYSSSGIFYYDEQLGCQALRVAIANSSVLNVDGVRYAFGSSSFTFCPHPPGRAFNLWTTRHFRNIRGLVQEFDIQDGGLGDRQIVRDLYLDQKKMPNFQMHLSLPPPSNGNIVVWAQTHLMGCGNYPEDRTDD